MTHYNARTARISAQYNPRKSTQIHANPRKSTQIHAIHAIHAIHT
ncbi:hypothetical protein OFO10_06515 [Campylobacter sp. VBCF_06 NA8]|nr:hypothetical protein [Campylobacter sp. VBCF_06 NA8]MDA3046807.1 hypothetical protein [Campylobacter sp. VBCF_06 NA8]